MSHIWKVLPFVPLAVAFVIISASAGQMPSEEISVESGLQMQGLGDVSGSGWVTWTITGQQARTLRAMIVMMFDESLTVPVGFPCAGDSTGATIPSMGNGVIDDAEAAAFIDCVGRVLVEDDETFRFVDVTSAEPANPAISSSTVGLVGSDANATGELRISFNYNVEGRKTVFKQAGTGMARAIHSVFDFLHTDNLQDNSTCPPACRPFRLSNGWRIVDSPPGRFNWSPGRFLWHGNWTATPWDVNASVYEENAYNSSYYTMNGGSTALLDLRFATSATLSFEHTGYAAENDGIEVKVRALGDTSSTELIAIDDRDGLDDLDNVTLDTLRTAVFDLTPWIGQEINMWFRFSDVPDGLEQGPGYYLRNFRIEAPSGPGGRITFRHSETALGLFSYYDVSTRDGRFSLVRTPVGNLMSYQVSYPAASSPRDVASTGLNALENPQVLFLALLLFLWLGPNLQRRVFESYRNRQIDEKTGLLGQEPWILWSNRALLVMLVLLYFFPTMFVGVDVVIGGAAFWGLGLFITLGMAMVARQWYARCDVPAIVGDEEPTEPPEPVIEVVEVRKEVKREATRELTPGLAQGYNYLVLSDNSSTAYEWFNGLVAQGVPGLCMSTKYPAKVRQERGVMEDVQIVWLSDTSKEDGSLDPRRLDFEIFRAISRFFSSNPKGAFLLDGLEHLIAENGFNAIDKFLKKVADLASMNGGTLIVPVSPSGFDEEQTVRLRKKFDRVETMLMAEAL